MEEIIRELGRKHNRAQPEIDDACKLLDDNWITSPAQWQALTSEQKRKIGLPIMLEQELEQVCELANADKAGEEVLEPLPRPERFCYFYQSHKDDLVFVVADDKVTKMGKSKPLSALLAQLPQPASLHLPNGLEVSPLSPCGVSLTPGRFLTVGGDLREILASIHCSGLERWLHSLGLRHLSHLFFRHGIDDFLVVPFLQAPDLELIGVSDPRDRRKILHSVEEIREGSYASYSSKWLTYVGLPQCLTSEFSSLRGFEAMEKDPEEASFLNSCLQQFAEYTSIEATHDWMRSNGFGELGFQLVRANIPFYALPMVNFFILNEMGMSDLRLWRALRELRDQPCYRVKAIAYWLRDLDLQKYTLAFARNLLVNFVEAQTILTDTTISQLIPDPTHQAQMRKAIQDMRNVQAYFSTTDTFLPDEIIVKYCHVFARYSKPLPDARLTDDRLLAMGIENAKDRRTIINCIAAVVKQLQPSSANQPAALGRARTGRQVAADSPQIPAVSHADQLQLLAREATAASDVQSFMQMVMGST